jgi:hypothetical protein
MKKVRNNDTHLRHLVYTEMREKRGALHSLWKAWGKYKETIAHDLNELDIAVDAALTAHAAVRFEDYDRLLEAKRRLGGSK